MEAAALFIAAEFFEAVLGGKQRGEFFRIVGMIVSAVILGLCIGRAIVVLWGIK